jgi:hypothetical protein
MFLVLNGFSINLVPESFPLEFYVQTGPLGTAPKKNHFDPKVAFEVSNDLDKQFEEEDDEAMRTSAEDTVTGASSVDVNTGFGAPIQGESSEEMHRDGWHSKKNPRAGLVGRGAAGELHEEIKDY